MPHPFPSPSLPHPFQDHFSLYLNVCQMQGGPSIRTEDACLLAIGYLRPCLLKYGGDVQ